VTRRHVTNTWYFTPNIGVPGDYTKVRCLRSGRMHSQARRYNSAQPGGAASAWQLIASGWRLRIADPHIGALL
jgi:hypothetical protein